MYDGRLREFYEWSLFFIIWDAKLLRAGEEEEPLEEKDQFFKEKVV